MIVLGISAFYHDSAAALIKDGQIIAAAQQERFSRIKHDQSFPSDAITYCLEEAGIMLDEVDHIAFYDKPLLTFNRLLETYLAYAPSGIKSFIKAIPIWMKEKILQKTLIYNGLNSLNLGQISEEKILFGFHHHSHASSAFYPSPFDEAAILVMDGVGEWATTSTGIGRGSIVKLDKEIRFPHSLGMLYSAFTYYLGFKVNDGEYKVMGLAPYGEPKYVQIIYENLINVKADGSYHLNMDYFNYCTGLTMTNSNFNNLFGAPPRTASAPLNQRDMDLARSIQVVTEDIVLKLTKDLYKKSGQENLCMAGGVALNCVANGRILREGPFKNIWIQPAAGDAGAAIGVALAICHTTGGIERRSHTKSDDGMSGSYLGPSFEETEIQSSLSSLGATYHVYTNDNLFGKISESLASESIVGWFQGRMEFGPRALGNRSIIGDPRSTKMQSMLNLKIKYREGFRPFAPAVLCEDASDYFEIDVESPYMLLVAPILSSRLKQPSKKDMGREGLDRLKTVRSDLPAITHVDNSARVQTVDVKTNPRFHKLISTFKQKTGCGVLVNTSFNVRDEPIVCTPEDAYRCFMATEMDVLVLENIVLFKEEQ
jgi:carbamoyltransferase